MKIPSYVNDSDVIDLFHKFIVHPLRKCISRVCTYIIFTLIAISYMDISRYIYFVCVQYYYFIIIIQFHYINLQVLPMNLCTMLNICMFSCSVNWSLNIYKSMIIFNVIYNKQTEKSLKFHAVHT